MRLLKISVMILIVVFINTVHSIEYFEEGMVDDVTRGVSGLHVGDINNDGLIDIVGAAVNDSKIVWWENTGSDPDRWVLHDIAYNFWGAGGVFVSDVNCDSLLDVIGTARGGDEIAWWENTGNLLTPWIKHSIDDSYALAHEVYACDYDSDGDDDIFAAASHDHELTWWRNDGLDNEGNVILVRQIIASNFSDAKSIHVGDFDNNDTLDVVGAALTNNEISWFRNDGIVDDEIQWSKHTVTESFIGAHRVQAVDLDRDGYCDILGAAYLGNEISWWRNRPENPGFFDRKLIQGGFEKACIAYAVDLDRDGDCDVIGTSQDGDSIVIWYNLGYFDNNLSWDTEYLDNFERVWPVCTADFNNDLEIDIVASSGQDGINQVKWWKNLGDDYFFANFGADPMSGNAPLTIHFFDQSTCLIPSTFWYWDFDSDENIDSLEENPFYTFTEPGEYSVSLYTGNDLYSDTIVKENYIRVFGGDCALEFDGEISYVTCSPCSVNNLQTQLTLEAWIKPYDWGEHAIYGFGRIIDKDKFSLYLVKDFYLSDYALAFNVYDQDNNLSMIATTENTIELNEWQHVALTYNSESIDLKLLINGVSQELVYNNLPVGSIADNSNIDITLGNAQGHNCTFDGVIDEVRIWNIERTEEEIEESMYSRLTGDEAGLVNYWNMNEGNGWEITDLCGNSGSESGACNWVNGFLYDLTPVEEEISLSSKSLASIAYPNPFVNSSNRRNNINIEFNLKEKGNLKVDIYNLKGQLINNICDKYVNSGKIEISWDLKDKKSNNIPSGIYFYKANLNNQIESKKIIIIR